MAIHPLLVNKPQNDPDWELWCKRIFQHVTKGLVFQRYKLPGANQHGIDLYATDADGKVVAVQCKKRNRANAVTRTEANADFARAKKHFPKLRAFYVATTHEATDLQDWAIKSSTKNLQVGVYAWGKIEDELRTTPALYQELAGDAVRNDPKAELAYCKALITQLDRMKLYALESAQSEVTDPQLTSAYVSLDISRITSAGEGVRRVHGSATIEDVMSTLSSDLTPMEARGRAPLDATDRAAETEHDGPRAVRRSNLLVLVGEAGRGKTTLLRYIAVSVAKRRVTSLEGAATGDATEIQKRSLPWNDRVPFYREVRRADAANPIDALGSLAIEITRPLAEPIDAGWPARVIAAKRGLVLLDGVDEVPVGQPRIKLLESLRKLVEANTETLFVISSRPAAAEGLRTQLAALSPHEAHVQPLAGPKLRDFIAFWHKAVGDAAHELYLGENRERRCEQITTAANALPDKLDDTPQVKALMATPLLAALVCAYHLDHNTLPENRSKLMLSLVNCLVHFHDTRRPGMPEWPAYARLDEDDKITLLGSIAAQMVRKRSPTIPFDTDKPLGTAAFDRHITDFLKTAGWFSKADLPTLRTGLKERTGILHEVHRGKLDFVHNEFRDYLAARHLMPRASKATELKALTGALADPDWHGLIYFAVTAERDKQTKGVADKLVRQLLAGQKRPPTSLRKRSERTKSEEASVQRYRSLRRLAFRLGGATPPVSKSLYTALEKVRTAMLPPETRGDAVIIAELGNRAVAQLAYNPKHSTERRAACAYALRLIDLPAAHEARAVYAQNETDWAVLEELAQTIPVTEMPFIARGITKAGKDFRMPDEMHTRLIRQAAGLVPGTPAAPARALARQLNLLKVQAEDEALGLFRAASPDAEPFAAVQVIFRMETGSDAAMMALTAKDSGLNALTTLNLNGLKVTDAAVKELARADTGLKALTTLNLYATQVADAGVKALASAETGLKALTVLRFEYAQVTDAGVKALARADTGLKALTELVLRGTQVTNAGVKALARANTGLSALTSLNLGGTKVTDAGVKELTRADTGLKALTSLNLGGTKMTDAWVKELARTDTGLKALTSLALSDTKVTDAGVKELARTDTGLTALTSLNLGGTKVTDAGVKELTRAATGLPALTSLNLSYTKVTDAGVKELTRADTGLKALTSLNLGGTKMTDAWVKELARADTGLKALTSLALSDTKVTDAGVKELARTDTGLKALTSLALRDTKVTDAGVKELARAASGLKALTSLNLGGTKVTDAGVKDLARTDTGLKALTSLTLYRTQVTDAGVKELARADTGLKALTSLTLFGTQVTDAGVKAVRARFPGINIIH